jgi:hypothetical protein
LPDLWKWTLASGLLAVILGILVLAWPGISILVAATLIAVYLLVSTLSPRFQHLHDTVADKQTKLDLHAALRGADLAEGYAISAEDVALAAIDEAEYAVGSPPSRRCSCGHRPQRRSPTMTTTSMACTHTTSTPRGFCRPNSDRAAGLRRHQPQCQPVCVDARHLRPERVHRQDSLRSDRIPRRGRRVLTSAAATVTEGTLGQACTHTPTSMGSSA